MTSRWPFLSIALASSLAITGCGADAEVEDGENDSFGGKADSIAEGSAEANGILALVNDPAVDFEELDVDAGLSSRVARNIIDRRPFETLAALDAVPYVGTATLNALLAYAREKGLVNAGPTISVIFSPQVAPNTHTAKAAQWIRAAQHSVDVAMYSWSDADVGAALTEAAARGVEVRMLFETANDDRKILDLTARTATKSGRLEKAGIDVRYVNKINHHKFVIVDGPRDNAERAKTAKLSTGSANWSNGGATVYDENTLFIEGSTELNLAFQKEFDYLWSHSRDFQLASPLPYVLSTATLGTADDAGLRALFTSPNFNINGTTFSLDWTKTNVSDQLVEAIAQADDSILVAEGHMRLRAVADALIAKKQSDPSIDIKVYLDQQEYISSSGDSAQRAEVTACLAEAGSDERDRFECLSKDFLFSKALLDAGIEMRFKSFAYRWNASYAVQMHSKYILIDGVDLYTGSYNLSMNSEQSTMENVVHLRGAQFPAVITAFQDNFARMWETGRAEGLLAQLQNTISTAQTIPLVFAPMALTYQEFTSLRSLIRSNCPLADSTEYRQNPGAHRTCPRQ
jgi:phosphatidylserine/phosphatidylglycerophosphate/cardiolipin synthase-like enzyme